MPWEQVYSSPNAYRLEFVTVADRLEPARVAQLYWRVTLPRCRRAALYASKYSGTGGHP